MFKEIFATMNEVLDEVVAGYAAVDGNTSELDEQLRQLKAMSDCCLDEWLRFEEKLSRCQSLLSASAQPVTLPQAPAGGKAVKSDHFTKGQGYYKLYMFDRAVQEFAVLVDQHPDFVLGRIYLAMGYLRLGDLSESYRQFKLIVPLTGNAKLKAISYNAMGCIQLHNRNMDKAYEYFKMADLIDSSCMEPSLWTKEFWPFRRNGAAE